MLGGDRRTDLAREAEEALARGLREANPSALFTAHAAPGVSAIEEYGFLGLDLNTTYTYDIVHKKLLEDYHRRPVMPFILVETTYEGEHEATSLQIRRQAYWALLSGAAGQCYGNRPVWAFDPGWKEALNAPGALDMARVKRLFDRIPWYDLEPDDTHAVVRRGLGEENGMDRLSAARTHDRRLLADYLPSRREIEVSLGQLSGSRFACQWYNPRSGKLDSREIIAEQAAEGKLQLTPTSEGDWVLLLHDEKLVLDLP